MTFLSSTVCGQSENVSPFHSTFMQSFYSTFCFYFIKGQVAGKHLSDLSKLDCKLDVMPMQFANATFPMQLSNATVQCNFPIHARTFWLSALGYLQLASTNAHCQFIQRPSSYLCLANWLSPMLTANWSEDFLATCF